MKIEMGESLMYSWLRHIKGCQIVQLNWKPSGKWERAHPECDDKLKSLMEKARKTFESDLGNIFKKTKSVDQLVKQAECDVLGIKLSEGKPEIFVVDIAFHKGGLLYGSTNESVAKVLVKCIRSAMCVYRYMNTKEATIMFAAPKVSKKTDNKIKEYIPVLSGLLNEFGFQFDVRVYTNEDFNKVILKPVIDDSQEIEDTSELFLRSYQLWRLSKE